MRKIKVIIKEPDKKPRCVNISDTLENLQKTVDGYIETVSFATDFVVICDEEGRLKNKPYCCNICGVNFFGTVILAGRKDDEFADLPFYFEDAKRFIAPDMFDEAAK